MFFFGKKQRMRDEADKEAQIQALREEAARKARVTVKAQDELIEFLKEEGATGRFFLATGANRRIKK